VSHAEIIAHRGFARDDPENTIAAFLAAAALGVQGIELDVHATADGTVVVHHDAHVTPGIGGVPVAIAALTAAELARVTAGLVPTLRDVLDAVASRITLYVEIKGPAATHGACELLATRAKCAVHSFDHRSIARCRDEVPSIPRGVLMTSYLLDPLAPLRDTGARDLWQHWELIDEELVARVHAHGGRVIAWTVNSPDAARRLTGMGVDGICTDSTDAMLSVFS
jgi:glycerophosphoryl diester phosphodiesterase